MEKLVCSIEEVGTMLGISKSYTYQLVRDGTIPSVQIGKKRIIPKERSKEWINKKSEVEKS